MKLSGFQDNFEQCLCECVPLFVKVKEKINELMFTPVLILKRGLLLSFNRNIPRQLLVFFFSSLPLSMLIRFMHIYIIDLYVEALLDCTRVPSDRWHAVTPVITQDTKSVL